MKKRSTDSARAAPKQAGKTAPLSTRLAHSSSAKALSKLSIKELASQFEQAGKAQSLEPKNSGVEKRTGEKMIRRAAKIKFRVGRQLPECE